MVEMYAEHSQTFRPDASGIMSGLNFKVTEYNVILCCTGSVASMKVPDIISKLQLSALKINAKIVSTDRAAHFFDLSALTVPCFSDTDLSKSEQNGDHDLVDELSEWADLLVIAPLDANSLGKIAAGVADNLLTTVVRSWDTKRPLLFAPAMNTLMWKHPVTDRNISVLCDFGFQEIKCVEKTLVCGDTGMGAMASVETIVDKIEEQLETLHRTALLNDLQRQSYRPTST